MNKKIVIIGLLLIGFLFIQILLKVETQNSLPKILADDGYNLENPLYFLNQSDKEIQEFFIFSDQIKPYLNVSLTGEQVSEIEVIIDRDVLDFMSSQFAFVKVDGYMNKESDVLEKIKVRADIAFLAEESFEILADAEKEVVARKMSDINFVQEIENVLKRIINESINNPINESVNEIMNEPIKEVLEENSESDSVPASTEEEVVPSDEVETSIELISEPEPIFIFAPAEEETLQVNEAKISIEPTQKTETETELKSESEPTSVPMPEVFSHGTVEVLYTFDGIIWKSLGFIKKDTFASASFKIPVKEELDLEDISKIQVGIRSIFSPNNIKPIIYLNSVWNEIEYKKFSEDPYTPPGGRKGDIILSEVYYENMVAVLVSRKPNTLIGSPKKELWLALFIAPVLDDTLTTTFTTTPLTAEKINWQKIADEEMVSGNSPLIFYNGIIFWLSPDSRAAVWFDTANPVYSSQTIENNGDTIIEFNAQKYILSVGSDGITIFFENQPTEF